MKKKITIDLPVSVDPEWFFLGARETADHVIQQLALDKDKQLVCADCGKSHDVRSYLTEVIVSVAEMMFEEGIKAALSSLSQMINGEETENSVTIKRTLGKLGHEHPKAIN